MGRGGAKYMNYTALVLLCAVSGASAGLWDVDINHDPAPAPEDGPPFSAHATRNRALLPYQVVGVLGAYLVTMLLVGTLLLTVGRKLRKQALTARDRPIELVQPYSKSPAVNTTPSTGPIRGLGGLWRQKSSAASFMSGTSHVRSPAGESVVSFDQSVIQEHRQRDNEAMASFYDQVWAKEQDTEQQVYAASATGQPTSPPAYGQNNIPRLDLDRVRALGIEQPTSPTTPRSPYRRVDPPDFYPLSPRAGYPLSPGSNGSSQHADSSTASPNRLRRGFKKSLKDRGLTISPPLRFDDNSDGARTPLSPRNHADPGRAPDLPTARTLDSAYAPTTPGTIDDYGRHPEEEMDVVRDLPSAHPQRADDTRNDLPSPAAPVHVRPELVIPPITFNKTRESPVSSTSNPLPLRQMNEHIRQQAAQQAIRTLPDRAGASNDATLLSPHRFAASGLASPGPQPQYAQNRLHQHGLNSALRSGGLMSPLYSPYQPCFVKVVTPRIATFAEQKLKEKEEKALHGAIDEEDQVVDEKAMWGESY